MKIHPGLGIVFWVIMLVCALALNHPAYVIVTCVFIVALTLQMDEKNNMKSMKAFILFTAVMIILVNPLVSQSGRTVLFQLRHVPVIGRIRITLEAICYGLIMAVKLTSVTCAFVLFSSMTDQDDMFAFMSGVMPKSTILFSMTVNVVHRIQNEIKRVHDVMLMRGLVMEGQRMNEKVRAALPLLKVVVISALEGSIDRAEALHVRGFGSGSRTIYKPIVFQKKDRMVLAAIMILLGMTLYAITSGVASYAFYPQMQHLNLMSPVLHVFLIGWIAIYICFQRMRA